MIYYRVRRKGARAEAMECKQPSLLKWGALSFTDAVVHLGTQLSCEHSCSFAVVSSQDDFQLRSLPLSSTHSPIHPQTHQILLGNFHPSCQFLPQDSHFVDARAYWGLAHQSQSLGICKLFACL